MKKALIYLSCMLACCLLFLYSDQAVSAGTQGFYIWRDRLLPSLLPFFVCANIMQGLGLPSGAEQAALILLSLFSGAPSGAKLFSSHDDAHSRSVAILNTVSPMFIYASFCSGMLGTPTLAIPILTAQFASAAILLLVFPPVYPSACSGESSKSPMQLLGESITAGISSMLNICGALVFFMALLAVTKELIPFPGGITGAILTGMLEMVSGCTALAELSLPAASMAAASAFLFSFGGVCIFAQSLTFSRISARVYFSVKLVQGLLAAAIAWLITAFFPSATAVFNSIPASRLLTNTISFVGMLGVSILAMSFVLLIGAAARHGKFFQSSNTAYKSGLWETPQAAGTSLNDQSSKSSSSS